MRLSISVRCGSPKLSFLPKYLVLACVGRISIVMSRTCTLLGVCRRRLWVGWAPLCKIFVLSGWSRSPTVCASVFKSASMLLMSVSEVATKRMSSANRKFVRVFVADACGCSGSPLCDAAHFCLIRRMTCSDTELKSKELSGSPCFTPRSIENDVCAFRTFPY